MPIVSICVLTYGNYPALIRRCLDSIIRYFPREQYRLLVGANAASEETLEYLRSLEKDGAIDVLVASEENINKCPMMRRLFALVDTEFIWWFDDDSWIKGPDTFARWVETARKAPASTAMWGHVFYFSREREFNYGHDMIQWVRSASWFKGLEPPSWAPGGKGVHQYEGKVSGDGRWFFATGGCWLIRKRAVDELNWPDHRLTKAADDVLLSEAVRQQGWRIYDMESAGLCINDHGRRGGGEGKGFIVSEAERPGSPPPQIPVPRSCAGAPSLLFGLTISDESPEQVEWCLYEIRDLYPKSVVIVLADDQCHPGIERRAKLYGAVFVRRWKLEKVAGEAAWWRRLFAEALNYSPDYIVRIDARTWVRRTIPISSGADLLGFVVHRGVPEEHIHHSLQCFSRRFAESFVRAVGEESHLRKSHGGSIARRPATIPTPGTILPPREAAIAVFAKERGFAFQHIDDIHIAFASHTPEKSGSDYTATYPHRISSRTSVVRAAPVEVVIMNWRRPRNVRRIVERFAAQSHVCRITLIDSASEPEFMLDEATLRLVDRRFVFGHNFGSFNRFVMSLGYSAEFTLFHDDDLLPGVRAVEHLLSTARRNPQFAVLGEFGRRFGADGSEGVEDEKRVPGKCREVDFVVRSYFVKTANLHHVWNSIQELDLRSEGCEDDLLLCTSIQRKTGWPCLVTPSGSAEECLASENLPEPFALWRRDDHFDRRRRFFERLVKTGWKPLASRESSEREIDKRISARISTRDPFPRYAVLAYRGSENLGDALQTYALSRLLPGACLGIYRERAGHTDVPVPVVANGWLGRNPGQKKCPAAFAGVFIGSDDEDNLRWLKHHSAHAVVGARDPFTFQKLASWGISAEMIGCATLTLPRYGGRRHGTLHIDDGTAGCLTQNIPANLPWEVQWRLAKERIAQIAQAAAVYTTRLHVALPCLALGTPVCFRPDGYQAAERFSIMQALGVPAGELVWMDVGAQAQKYREFVSNVVGTDVQFANEPEMPLVMDS